MHWVIIGPGNGLSPVQAQAITWTNVNTLSIRTLGIILQNLNQDTNIFIHKNTIENGVCKITAIMPQPQYVTSTFKSKASKQKFLDAKTSELIAFPENILLPYPHHWLHQTPGKQFEDV